VHPDDMALLNSHRQALRKAQTVRFAGWSSGRVMLTALVWLATRETPFERSRNGSVSRWWDRAGRQRAQSGAGKAHLPGELRRADRPAQPAPFLDAPAGALRRASIQQDTIAVCLFDVDRFKRSTTGLAMRRATRCWKRWAISCARSSAPAATSPGALGGDEFCFALARHGRRRSGARGGTDPRAAEHHGVRDGRRPAVFGDGDVWRGGIASG